MVPPDLDGFGMPCTLNRQFWTKPCVAVWAEGTAYP
jgi:hypothetical protein